MAKSQNDDILDAAFDEAALATVQTACSAEPTTRTEAIATYALADITLTAGDGNGDFTIANGDTSGRKLTTAQQADVAIDIDGTATHVAQCDATRLLRVTTCTSQALVDTGTVTFPAWDDEIADAT